jgi:hypothetical protein
MFHRRLLLPASLLFVCLVQCRPATAQATACSAHSNTLYCLPNSPTLFGFPAGVTPFAPIFSALGSQLSLLPTASPASGITLRFDRAAGVPVRSTESLGPVLSERAETIGKNKLFLGFTFQRIGFDSMDGTDLKNVPLVFDVCVNGACSASNPPDVVATNNRVDLKVNQFTSIATYGLTSRIDLSVSVPFETVRLGMSRKTSLFLQGSPTSNGRPVFPAPVFGEQDASGIGDVVARAKGTIFSGERLGVAAGVDIRFPTGDELDFLGSGAYGVKPFVAASYRARISPHANFGYQWNGDSILASPTGASTSSKKQLPTDVFYSVGFEVPTKRVTFAADFLSFHVFDALRLSPTTRFGQPNLAVTTNSFTTSDGSIGFKFNPMVNLIITTNVDIKLDHNGLRHRLIPLVGLAYTF